MKRAFGTLLLSTLFATAAAADQITFSFVGSSGSMADLTASNSGLTAGPALNILVTDVTTGVSNTLPGIFTASTGPASAFLITSGLVLGTYTAGGADSVLIVDPMTLMPIVSGTMDDMSLLLAKEIGAGSFLGTFDVSFVSPSVLAMFGLTSFSPSGSVSMTFAQDSVKGGALSAVVGGGSVTVTGFPVRELASLLYVGTGLLMLIAVRRIKAA